MPAFSTGRDVIFTRDTKIRFQIGGFPDFYALLGVARDAPCHELEESITARGADLLAASFSRGGKGELLSLLERHITDFRPILLDKVTRLSYDEQLQRHESNDPRAISFEAWQRTHSSQSRLTRGIKHASTGLKARLKSAFWDSEYF